MKSINVQAFLVIAVLVSSVAVVAGIAATTTQTAAADSRTVKSECNSNKCIITAKTQKGDLQFELNVNIPPAKVVLVNNTVAQFDEQTVGELNNLLTAFRANNNTLGGGGNPIVDISIANATEPVPPVDNQTGNVTG